MEPVHLHLALNHVPVVGLGFAFVTLATGFLLRNQVLQRLALVFFVAIAVAAWGVRSTGEGAEDAVENLPGVTERAIESHEDAANRAMAVAVALGVAALAGLIVWRSAPAPRWYPATLLVLTVVAGGLMAQTANLGGQVRHTEIRAGAATAAGQQAVEQEHDDDD